MLKNIALAVTFCSLVAMVAGLVIFTTLGSLTNNPVSMSLKSHELFFTVLPQGWSFFTKSPRDARLTLYQKENDIWVRIDTRIGTADRLFGAKRQASMISAQIAETIKNIRNESFTDCREPDPGQCPVSVIHVAPNLFGDPLICGEVLIKSQPPIPWAWYRNHDSLIMPYKVLKMKLICD